jgi:Cdc6-like AAA superfamily ATPase
VSVLHAVSSRRIPLIDRCQRSLLVLDEVDVLLPQRSAPNSSTQLQLFKTFLALPSAFPSINIKVISISNSLDLTFRGNVASALGEHVPHNLIFRAYEAKEMIDIVSARVKSITSADLNTKVQVDDKAIELVGRKVEAQNGDLRMCLSVMVAAVEMSEADYKKKVAAGTEAGACAGPAKVSLPHVSKAVMAFNKLRAKISGNPTTQTSTAQSAGSAELNGKIRALSLQVRMVLLSYLIALQRQSLALRPLHAPAASASYGTASPAKTGGTLDTLSPEALYPTYAHLLNHPSGPFPPASQPDYMDLIMQLEVLGLFSLEAGAGSPSKAAPKAKKGGKGREKAISLLAKEEDLKIALGIVDGSGGGAIQDEVRSIWAREDAKCQQAIASRERAAESARRKAEQTCAREDLL